MVTLAAPVSPDDQEIILSELLNGDTRLPYRIVADDEAMLTVSRNPEPTLRSPTRQRR